MAEWRKAIPQVRDRMQAKVLVGSVGTLLLLCTAWLLVRLCVEVTDIGMPRRYHAYPLWFILLPWVVSLTFALVVWAVRAATTAGILFGSMICLLITAGTGGGPLWHSALPSLVALFVLTFAATKAGKARKVQLGLAEDRRGRNAAQVIANLGLAGLLPCAAIFRVFDWNRGAGGQIDSWDGMLRVLVLAALCEATADTVSSEIGQAFGGRPWLITRMRRVEAGTDGAVSLMGTAAGMAAGALVVGLGVWSMQLPARFGWVALVSGVAGLVFDSLLGATVERRGWLGNDWVNFVSTGFAVGVAAVLLGALR